MRDSSMNPMQARKTRLSRARSVRTRAYACAAVLLLQVNMALAVEPLQSASPNPQQAQPESPTPATNGTAAPTPTLSQAMQDAQRQPVATPRPFHVDLPRSHKPFSPYMPSTVPELDLTNSPRLQSLIREGKLCISL